MCVYVASSLERKESGCDAVDVIWCMSIFASRCCLVVWVLYVCVCALKCTIVSLKMQVKPKHAVRGM